MPRSRSSRGRGARRSQPYPTERPSNRRRSTRSSRLKRNAMHGDVGEGRLFRMSDEAFWDFMYAALDDAKDGEEEMEGISEKASTEPPAVPLSVEGVDLHKQANRKAHNTHEFEKGDLIIRRGQPFDMTITFNRDIKSIDLITLQLMTGTHPMESKGSLLHLHVILSGNKPTAVPSCWSVSASDPKGRELCLQVHPPADAIIGRYRLSITTKIDKEKRGIRKELEDEDIIVLFNPWCSEDETFVEKSDWRQEYVMNERGRIWVGSARSFCGRPWYFGQFDDPCLDVALLLLDRAELGESARRNPVPVVRAISAQANSMDDNGVLEGRWSEKYPKTCTVPWAWNGSVAILKQFMEKEKPVRYGQCWVFSGITTTLLRALGLATRSVTNFESAHDTDSSMTIDSHWESVSGEPLPDLDDSVWNFHVWNESYFRRNDLPVGYDGWQAHDATPQECSEGVMRCGPASLKAIKEGCVYFNHDTGFIFAEVNGDRVHWEVDASRSMHVVNVLSHAVGHKISTKAVGCSDREDVTHLYKYPEGSKDERRVVEMVHRFGTRKDMDIYGAKEQKAVTFDFHVPETAKLGEDLQIKVRVRNTSGTAVHVMGRLSALASFYTGVSAQRLVSKTFDLDVPAFQEAEAELAVREDDYLGKLCGEAAMILLASFRVAGTKQFFVSKEILTLDKPELKLKVPAQVQIGDEMYGEVSFRNPLNLNLTNAAIHVEGGGVSDQQPFRISKPIKSGAEEQFKFRISPRMPGQREVVATFTSDQLTGVDGSAEYMAVQP